MRIGFGVNPGYGASAYSQSALMWFQIMKAIAEPGGRLLTVAGGNQHVPDAMAAALGDRVRLGTVAHSITSGGDGVEVRTIMDGSRYRGRQAVVTLPASALRTIDIDPVPPLIQRRGLRSLPYNRVVRAYFVPERRFWEEDGLPPSIWSDSYAGRVFALHGGGGEITMIQSFITGPAAERLDRMPKPAALALVQAEIERIRPAARGALRPAALVSWGNDPFAGGAYACWAPGQINSFANALAQPHGRLTFAGEHTAIRTRGIEGALESAERAAGEILVRL